MALRKSKSINGLSTVSLRNSGSGARAGDPRKTISQNSGYRPRCGAGNVRRQRSGTGRQRSGTGNVWGHRQRSGIGNVQGQASIKRASIKRRGDRQASRGNWSRLVKLFSFRLTCYDDHLPKNAFQSRAESAVAPEQMNFALKKAGL